MKIIYSKRILTLATAVTFALLNYLNAEAQIEKPFTIGAILHLSGDLEMQSAAFREGLELGLQQVNAGKPDSQKMQLQIEDGRNQAQASNTAARKLIGQGINAAIISSYLDAMSDGSLFEKAQIPAITIWDSNPEIENLGEYIFAIGPATKGSGEQPARYAIDELKAKTAVIISNQDPYAEGASNYFEALFKQKGGQILGRYMFGPNDTDLRSALSKIKKSKPDFIYAPIVYNVLPLFKQYKGLNFTQPIFAADTISEQTIAEQPNAFEGVYQTHIHAPDSKELQKLRVLYQAKFQKPLKLDWFVAVGYDAIQMISFARESGAQTGQELKDALYKIQNFPGASTTLSINPAGSAPVIESIYQIKNGKQVWLRD